MNKIGKDQSYPREINNFSVMKLLSESPSSGTEIASELTLSNSTVSSILQELMKKNLIEVKKTNSVNHYGRKRVFYQVNCKYGMTLTVNISNMHAIVSVCSMQNEAIESTDMEIDNYNATALYKIILEASRLVIEHNEIPLRCIVFSVPGRVNEKNGELLLSKQFDPELFRERNFIQSAFSRQFPNVPVYLFNDIKLKAFAELKFGSLKEVKNAIYLSVDYGIGGALIIGNEVYRGDNGFAGEFGYLHYFDGTKDDYIDNYASLKYLVNKAESITGKKKVHRAELADMFRSNKEIHDIVIDSAYKLGKSLVPSVNILDVSTICLSGKITLFGQEYLDAFNEGLKGNVSHPKAIFSNLKERGELVGAAYMGTQKIIGNAIIRK